MTKVSLSLEAVGCHTEGCRIGKMRLLPWTKNVFLISLLANFSPFWVLGGWGQSSGCYSNQQLQGVGVEKDKWKGTFLLLIIKGKNKRGTMKIKENKQWSRLFFSMCLRSPAVCPTMGIDQTAMCGIPHQFSLHTRTERHLPGAKVKRMERQNSSSPFSHA